MTFRELSFSKKIEFIWDYYKIHILMLLLAILFAVSMIGNILTQSSFQMNVVMVNMSHADEQIPKSSFYLFLEQYGYDLDEDIIDVKEHIYISGDEEFRNSDIQNLQYFMTILAVDNPEIYFGPRYLLENYARQGCFVDLSSLLTDELMKIDDCRLVYAVADDQQAESAYGFSVNENQWFLDNGYFCEECCFGIFATADNPAIAKEFAQYLLSFEI